MGKIRFFTALISAKIVYYLIRIIKHSGGTSLAGMIALKICPDFIKYCQPYTSTVFTITGTNGKTTTSGILAHILGNDGCKIIHNVKGANMLTGIANAFALSILPFKKYDYAVLESDEAYLTKLYDYLCADFLLVTNLFRDQLDRYGELETTAGYIKNAINKNSELILLLNADDPLVTNLGKDCQAMYYGFEEIEFCSENQKSKSSAPSENFRCPCGNDLEYTQIFFAQQGHYFCSKCGYKRPKPDFKGKLKVYDDYSVLNIEFEGKNYEFKINLVGLYNAYNALAAISQAIAAGVDYETIYTGVESYKSVFGRAEKRVINGHETLIQLIKNPTGASEVLKTVDLNSNILIAINDNYADGRDISWLWDSDFEQLKGASKLIVTSGTRAKDMALRLKYAGISQDRIIVNENIAQALAVVCSSDNIEEKVTILPSYTALLEITKIKF